MSSQQNMEKGEPKQIDQERKTILCQFVKGKWNTVFQKTVSLKVILWSKPMGIYDSIS